MQHQLPALPFAMDALAPHISRETLDYHYGKHHQTYVKTLNELIKNTEFSETSLEDIIKRSSGVIFNNAAQVWNHNFYWQCLTPARTQPDDTLANAIQTHFGSVEKFKEEFQKCAIANFGSGWTWLLKKSDGKLAIHNTDDAKNPLIIGDRPLLTCDVWEHAYYIDYRNERAKYLSAFWEIVNWDFVAKNFDAANA